MKRKLICIWRILFSKSYYAVTVGKGNRTISELHNIDVNLASDMIRDLVDKHNEAVNMEKAVMAAGEIANGIG